MQHILNTIMSTADLLKIIMLAGIVFALLASRWINKNNDKLDEEIRRGSGSIEDNDFRLERKLRCEKTDA
jgi:hypothetical protein